MFTNYATNKHNTLPPFSGRSVPPTPLFESCSTNSTCPPASPCKGEEIDDYIGEDFDDDVDVDSEPEAANFEFAEIQISDDNDNKIKKFTDEPQQPVKQRIAKTGECDNCTLSKLDNLPISSYNYSTDFKRRNHARRPSESRWKRRRKRKVVADGD